VWRRWRPGPPRCSSRPLGGVVRDRLGRQGHLEQLQVVRPAVEGVG
jgi:hypothetical protein